MAEGVFTLDLNDKFPRLSRPPIVEAVIHWQARAQNALEPKAIDAALAERLPQYGTREPIQQVEVMAMVSGEAPSPVVQHRRDWRGTRLKSADGRSVIQFTRDGLVFSRTKEYENWEPFRDAAKEAWRVFLDIAAPVETQRLGVRFINHFAGATPATLPNYLRDPPTCPSNMPLKQFVYQSTFDVPGHPFGVRVIKVMQPSMPELQQSSGLFLDIDVFSTIAIPNELGPLLDEALTRMRWLKNKVFFSLMTDAAVKSFM
jgi:uncharacterized protein (TIGR04255 family)